ncbi:unnamed protein product [Caenorhabditis auriculariae]|uniref:Uncharacterized protein n=1 Tax=Caenorhabditis auriculariae TaxID=2777116 RepID=A0A8S1H9L0_9PELO|nr:unnamed protein product [Caenorhabditis auriculariae]
MADGAFQGFRPTLQSTRRRFLLFSFLQRMAGEDQRTLLMSSATSSSVLIQRFDEGDQARQWPCASCANILAIVHLLIGVSLLVFDLATNDVSKSVLAVSASFVFIICAIFCFITTCRLDKCAQILLFWFAFVSVILSTGMFLLSGSVLNSPCFPADGCSHLQHVVHAQIVVLSLVEFTTSIITMFVCFRSLRNAFGVLEPHSPYRTLMVGDYSTLAAKPQYVR